MISAFDSTVTLFNRIGEDENGCAAYAKTVIDRVRTVTSLCSSEGGDAEPKSLCRIYFSFAKSKARDGKKYLSPSEWENGDKSGSFTFTSAGDLVVIGEYSESYPPDGSMLITEASHFDARLKRLRHVKLTCAL